MLSLEQNYVELVNLKNISTNSLTFPLLCSWIRDASTTDTVVDFLTIFSTLPLFSLSNSPSPRAREPIAARSPAVSNVCAVAPRPVRTSLVGFEGDVISPPRDWPKGARRRANGQTQRWSHQPCCHQLDGRGVAWRTRITPCFDA